MIPLWQRLQHLTGDRTHTEIALRAYEYIQYSAYKRDGEGPQPDVYAIAEVTWFNCLTQLLINL
ncbi:MAG: hypothetical protein F6K09_16910, partial [Merismopedia sp. SIO2A8]|nr:hypothetical protein [Merismopedia sp. SIO2A8]